MVQKVAVTGGADAVVRVWDTRTGGSIRSLIVEEREVLCVRTWPGDPERYEQLHLLFHFYTCVSYRWLPARIALAFTSRDWTGVLPTNFLLLQREGQKPCSFPRSKCSLLLPRFFLRAFVRCPIHSSRKPTQAVQIPLRVHVLAPPSISTSLPTL